MIDSLTERFAAIPGLNVRIGHLALHCQTPHIGLVYQRGKDPQMATNTHLMTPAEVAEAFGVDPKTVARWAKAGRLSVQMTLGGHRRYVRHEVEAAVETMR